MEKIFFILSITTLISLVACEKQELENTSTSGSIQETINTQIEETPKIKENKIVTLNGGAFYSVTNFEEYAKENDYISAIKNDDNTVTLAMTQKRYEKLLSDTISTAEKSFSNTIQKNTAVKRIEHNNDLTELTIFVDSANYNYKNDTTYYNAYLNTSFYRMLDKPDAKCKVIIKDETTNEVVFEITYPLDK